MNTIKKTVLISLAFIMIVALAACGGPKKQVAPQGENLVISPSADWKEVKSATMNHYTNKTASIIVTWAETEETDVNAYVSKMQQKYASEYENSNFEPVDEYTLAGVPFKRLRFTAKVLNMDMQYHYLYLIGNGHIYTITLADVEKNFGQTEPEFYNIMGTAKFE